MALEEMVKQVAELLEKEGNSKAVFGEVVKLDTHNIMPVAVIEVGGGGGGAGARQEKLPVLGGGGALALKVRPVGFIQEKNGEVLFTPIHVDVRDKPFLTEASSGLGKAIDAVVNMATHALDHKGHKN